MVENNTSEPSPPEGSRPQRRTWWAVAAIAVLVLVVVAVVVSSGVLGSKPDVTVPDVVGKTIENARTELADAGLRVQRVNETYSVRVSEGVVVAQTPSAGSLIPQGAELTLEIAKGVEPGSIPDVAGMDVEDAIDAIDAAGYTVVIKEATADGVKYGTVIEQSASGTEVEAGGQVTITVSVGAVPDVQTPNVVGVLQPAAVSILHEAGLRARSYWVRSTTSREVVHQYPPAGMPVAPGTVVTLSVAAGMDNPTIPAEVVVP